MDREINQKRIHSIRLMLLEMASGNFSQRIPRTGEDDELESLIVLVNMAAEEMEETLFPNGYINTHHLQHNPSSISFIVDEHFRVLQCTFDTGDLLGYSTSSLENKEFVSILSTSSAEHFKRFQKSITANEEASSLSLTYLMANGRTILSLYSSISKLSKSNCFIICSILPSLSDFEDSLNDSTTTIILPKTRRADAKIMQQVYDYILANLETPLPSIKELSRMFGTNEYKLKEGFRYFFNTSIYHFYNDERLKRSQLLIRQTNIPLKQIAYMHGFNSYPSFSKAFKKKYGCAPKDLK